MLELYPELKQDCPALYEIWKEWNDLPGGDEYTLIQEFSKEISRNFGGGVVQSTREVKNWCKIAEHLINTPRVYVSNFVN